MRWRHTRRLALGRVRATPEARECLDPDDMVKALRRHAAGDKCDSDPILWEANDADLEEHEMRYSVFSDRHGTMFWIVTDADRCCTTILLPEED